MALRVPTITRLVPAAIAVQVSERWTSVRPLWMTARSLKRQERVLIIEHIHLVYDQHDRGIEPLEPIYYKAVLRRYPPAGAAGIDDMENYIDVL
jgi:hypothetical protein